MTSHLEKRFPLSLASVAMDLDKFEYLAEYQKNGIALLEVTPMVLDNRSWRVRDRQSTRDFIALCRRYQVRPDSVHGFYLAEYGHDMADADPETRQRAIALNIDLIRAAAELEARYLVIHLFNESHPRSKEEALDIARTAVSGLLPAAEATGIHLAIENLKPGWTVREINTLLDEFSHPLLGICLDTGHTVLYNRLDDEWRQCGHRLLGMHIHDNHLQTDDHLIPFRGTIDWRVFCKALLENGYSGPLMFEAFSRREHESVPAFITACREAYERLLAEIEGLMI